MVSAQQESKPSRVISGSGSLSRSLSAWITHYLPYWGHGDPGSVMLSTPVYRWVNVMRLREVGWPGSSFNCQGQNLNSGLLTSSLWSTHCPPAASWAPFLGHSSKTSQLPAIWGGKVFSGNRLTHWGWLFSLVHLTRSSPQSLFPFVSLQIRGILALYKFTLWPWVNHFPLWALVSIVR